MIKSSQHLQPQLILHFYSNPVHGLNRQPHGIGDEDARGEMLFLFPLSLCRPVQKTNGMIAPSDSVCKSTAHQFRGREILKIPATAPFTPNTVKIALDPLYPE
jgi:hypothetical protein